MSRLSKTKYSSLEDNWMWQGMTNEVLATTNILVQSTFQRQACLLCTLEEWRKQPRECKRQCQAKNNDTNRATCSQQVGPYPTPVPRHGFRMKQAAHWCSRGTALCLHLGSGYTEGSSECQVAVDEFGGYLPLLTFTFSFQEHFLSVARLCWGHQQHNRVVGRARAAVACRAGHGCVNDDHLNIGIAHVVPVSNPMGIWHWPTNRINWVS